MPENWHSISSLFILSLFTLFKLFILNPNSVINTIYFNAMYIKAQWRIGLTSYQKPIEATLYSIRKL